MTQEEKKLLLKDLSAKLPYGVVVHYNGLARPLFGIEPTQHFQITLDNALDGEHNGLVYVSLDVDGEEPKPYLRPMSSMTEEEKEDLLITLLGKNNTKYFQVLPDGSIDNNDAAHQDLSNFNIHWINFDGVNTSTYIDWLNAHHFDYRGLIPLGLAVEVTEDNNPYKE